MNITLAQLLTAAHIFRDLDERYPADTKVEITSSPMGGGEGMVFQVGTVGCCVLEDGRSVNASGEPTTNPLLKVR